MAVVGSRFEFGKNWSGFISRKFSEERVEIAKKKILDFLGLPSLQGLDFLDIGSGSGIHSLAALRAGAGRVWSFDYDADSVAATRLLHGRIGSPANWVVEQGDVLSKEYLARLGKRNLVYCWGELDHTGDVWQAVRNAQECVADGGWFYLALYSADVETYPSKAFWQEIKQEYNRVTPFTKWLMMWWYVWRFDLGEDIRRLPRFVAKVINYRFQRGMSTFVDIRDWIGGWPMEYAGDQQTVDLLEGEYGFELVNVSTGQACSEFLFKRTGVYDKKTNVRKFVTAKKIDNKLLA